MTIRGYRVPLGPFGAGLIALATLAKLWLAYAYRGNFDQESYEIVQNLVLAGKPVYCETYRYVQTPLWFHLLWVFGKVSELTGLPSHFVIRSTLTGVDLLSAVLIYKISKLMGVRGELAAFLFLVNPLAVLLTDYHGQFENLTLLGILGAVYVQLRGNPAETAVKMKAWGLTTLAVVLKHNVMFAPVYVLSIAFPKAWQRLVAMGATGVVFLLTFLPYVPECGDKIVEHVFRYASVVRPYGIPYFFPETVSEANMAWYKFVLLAVLTLGGLLTGKLGIARAYLFWTLLFLVITPGVGAQYFTLPLLFGCLRPGAGYAVFSIAGFMFLLVNPDNVGAVWFPQFAFSLGAFWNIMWIAAAVWFILVCFDRDRHEERT